MGPFRSALPLGLVLLLGCGSEPPDEITGTYALVGVEGEPLPYLESSDAECDQFISEGELALNPGGTYNLEFSGPYDCSRGGGQTGTLGRLYNGNFTQSGTNSIAYEAAIQGAGTLHFTGTANPLEAFVTVPPIPPQTGPDLTLQFAIVP
ncbi:MAG TPA: hypothetical protein VNO19_07005 [Gemmatimonadales bacterium]|nr:hypothetical protein [Gemmatimonadales bacterium]